MKAILLQLHRWLGVLLFPLFAMIVLSGALLALKPMVESARTPDQLQPVAVEQLVALVDEVAGEQSIRGVQRLDEGTHWRLDGLGDYRLADGAVTGDGSDPLGRFFGGVKSFHKGLLLGLGWLVEYASWAMAAIVVAALFFGWPRFRNSLLGWHHALGLWLFPLAALLPITALMMTLHIGQPGPPPRASGPSISLTEGLQRAAQQHDLSTLISAGARRGSVMISTARERLLVNAQGVTEMQTYWPKALHEGTWGGWFSGLVNLLAGVLLFALSLTGFLSWLRRQRGAKRQILTEGAEVLVLHASQTGTAQGLAEATSAALTGAGIAADCAALGRMAPSRWAHYKSILLIASTTGEGELPEGARPWVRALTPGALKGARFSLLALGDRRYPNFCGGGKQLRQALLAADAEEFEPLMEVDGDPSNDWRSWFDRLAQREGWTVERPRATALEQCIEARLLRRTRLDSGDDPGVPAAFSLELSVAEETRFSPGDLIQFQPGADEQPRRYSIGSDSQVTPGRIRLTISWVHYRDAQGEEHFGRASTLLCRDWQEGDSRSFRINRHAGFHPPEDHSIPLILLATGCGIAPFMGFLEQRAGDATAGPVWLLFGNRHRRQDFLHGEELERYHRDGVLTRLDGVFSRDGGAQRYVTERLRERGAEILEWLDAGARIYICGRASTLGRSSEQALLDLLQQGRGLTADGARQELERWSAEGILHRDLFD